MLLGAGEVLETLSGIVNIYVPNLHNKIKNVNNVMILVILSPIYYLIYIQLREVYIG